MVGRETDGRNVVIVVFRSIVAVGMEEGKVLRFFVNIF